MATVNRRTKPDQAQEAKSLRALIETNLGSIGLARSALMMIAEGSLAKDAVLAVAENALDRLYRVEDSLLLTKEGTP